MVPSTHPYSTSTSLLEHAQTGEDDAWCRLIELYTPLIARWCRRQGVRPSDVDDVVQNVLVAVSRSLARFDQHAANSTFRGWLWTIARSKIIDHLRQRNALPMPLSNEMVAEIGAVDENTIHDSTAEPDDSAEAGQDLALLIAKALELIRGDFTEQTWSAFWRTTALGHRPSEVAADFGMSPSAVCMCRARVLRRLRETLGHF